MIPPPAPMAPSALSSLVLWLRYLRATTCPSLAIVARHLLRLPFPPSSPPAPSSASLPHSAPLLSPLPPHIPAPSPSLSKSAISLISASENHHSPLLTPLHYDHPKHPLLIALKDLSRAQRTAVGITLTVRDANGGCYPREHGPYIFALLNQTSLVESMLVSESPMPFTTFANVEYLLVPFAGWLTGALGAIPVVRQWKWHTRRAVQRAEAFLSADPAHAMYMSVEGRRSVDGSLGPYRLGCARMALATGATIVPMVVRGARECLPFGSWRLRGGACVVEYLPAIHTRQVPRAPASCGASVHSRDGTRTASISKDGFGECGKAGKGASMCGDVGRAAAVSPTSSMHSPNDPSLATAVVLTARLRQLAEEHLGHG